MTTLPFSQYSATQLRHLTGGTIVSPILPFESPSKEISRFNGNRGRISLSGAQSKYSVVVRDGQFPLGIGNKDFHSFGILLGIPEKTVTRELERFTADYPEIARMVNASFLSEESKQNYYSNYRTRLVSFLRA